MSLIFLFFLWGQTCPTCQKGSLEKLSEDISENLIELSCPESVTHNLLIMKKDFSALGASSTIQSVRTSIQRKMSEYKQNSFACKSPCVRKQKHFPTLRVLPKETNPNVVCQTRYKKTHTYKKSFTCKTQAQCESSAADWVQHTLVGPSTAFVEDSEEGEELYEKCPDPCSFSSEQLFVPKNETGLEVTLNVSCVDPRKGSAFTVEGYIYEDNTCAHP